MRNILKFLTRALPKGANHNGYGDLVSFTGGKAITNSGEKYAEAPLTMDGEFSAPLRKLLAAMEALDTDRFELTSTRIKVSNDKGHIFVPMSDYLHDDLSAHLTGDVLNLSPELVEDFKDAAKGCDTSDPRPFCGFIKMSKGKVCGTDGRSFILVKSEVDCAEHILDSRLVPLLSDANGLIFGERWVTVDYGEGFTFASVGQNVQYPNTAQIEKLINDGENFVQISDEDLDSINTAIKYSSGLDRMEAVQCADGVLSITDDMSITINPDISMRLNPKFLAKGLSVSTTINTPRTEMDPTVFKGERVTALVTPMRKV